MKPFSFLLLIFLATQSFAQNPKRLLMLGDSLTEGYGVAREEAYPAVLETLIQKAGKHWLVVNAGISGSTTASGVSRLKWQFKNKPDLMVLALGANDGLRGLKIADTEKNLAATIELAQKEKVPVVLAGMLLPPNYGEKYRQDFAKMYVNLAAKYHLRKIPFLLEGVAGKQELNQIDGIHPNAAGHKIVAEHVFQAIKDLL